MLIVVMVTMFVSSCASTGLNMHSKQVTKPDTQFFLSYDSAVIILDQSKIATITSANGLEIDGVEVNPKNMRVANAKTGFFQNNMTMIVDMLPGEHSVKILYSPNGMKLSMNPIKLKFEAGHIYTIGNSSAFTPTANVVENTSADVAKKIVENRNNAVFEKK